MQVLSESEFKSKISGTLIVQFSATWCGPCKTLTAKINANTDIFNHEIYKMDIDDSHDLCLALGISTVPTLIRFENSKEVKRLSGNKSLSELKDFTS
jgi:thioredoxin 1